MKNFKTNHLKVVKAILALSLLCSIGSGWANTGNGQYTNLSGTVVNEPTFFANSPIGLHVSTTATPTCFTGSGTGVLGTPVAFGLCDTGHALTKFIDPLPLPAMPGGAAIAKTLNKYFIPNAAAVTNGKYIPMALPIKWVNPNGVTTQDDYYEIAVVEYQERMHSQLTNVTTLRGYVQIDPAATDSAAGLVNGAIAITGSQNVALTNIDGTPVLIPRPDISVPPSTVVLDSAHVRGNDGAIYKLVQAHAVDKPHYLGPLLTASKNVPTRIKFINLLPTGRASGTARNGDIFLPVDETLPGAGFGPDGKFKFTQNRAMLHLHGGDNPWISDGTPHQWITPAGESMSSNATSVAAQAAALGVDPTHYLKGWSAINVPDMPDPGPGAMTYYYPNGESARMEWYHDHTFGLTRLNVYAGMASAYFLTDPSDGFASVEGTVIPSEQIALVFQDKTFTPKDIATEDARWDTTLWGGESGLWYPHVYETNQLPKLSIDGTNAPGRWDWGPWFWPVFPSYYDRLPTGAHVLSTNTVNGVVANTGLSEVTLVPEAYFDTPVVNGQAYPTLTVDPKAYRFRMLNASDDRYFNFGLYLAADKNTTNAVNPADPTMQPVVCDGVQTNPKTNAKPALSDCTEVKMVNMDTSYPSLYYGTSAPSFLTPDGHTSFPTAGGLLGTGWGIPQGLITLKSGVPDPATAGPSMTLIGNETGYLANAVNIPSTIINYEIVKQAITLLNIKERGLFLTPAGRADVVIDFSQYAGKTLILYNDSPAPLPAGEFRNDYFTGMGDYTGAGGPENVLPGQGPNTRTVMQIYVNPINTGTTGTGITASTPAISSAVSTLFAANQPMPIVPDGGYANAFPAATPSMTNTANYGTINTGTVGTTGYIGYTFTTNQALNYTQIPSGCLTQATCTSGSVIATAAAGAQVLNAEVKNKAIQELFEPTFGRMNATLGVELPYMTALTATTIPLGYVDPATETIPEGQVQFWRITHNGVDSHPVHFHLVNVQVINRVDWAGIVKPPTPDEFGWKETVVMHPLEDVFVAVRAKTPSLPFGLPLSVRPRDPSQALGVGGNSTVVTAVNAPTLVSGFTQIDPITGNPTVVTNQMDNYQWEYVWHCHILGHEENDFMRPFVFDYWNAKNASATVTTQSGTKVAASTGVTLSAVNANIVPGMMVSGTGIPNGTTVAAVSGTSLTLSNAATSAGSVTLTFSTYSNLPPAPTALAVAVNSGKVGVSWVDPTPVFTPTTVNTPNPATYGTNISGVNNPVVITGGPNPKNEIGYTLTVTDTSVTPNASASFNVLANQTTWNYPAPLADGHAYKFSLLGYNALGNGLASLVNFTPSSGATLPTALSVTAVTASSMTLNWTGSGVGVNYYVQYSTNNANWVTLPATTASSLTISNLLANQAYYLRVGASLNGGASMATASLAAPVSTNALPAVSISASTTGPSTTVATATANLSWVLAQGGGTPVITFTNSTGVAIATPTGAVVTMNAAGSNGQVTGAVITGLSPATAYYLKLTVSGSNNVASAGLSASFTTNVLPATVNAATSITTSGALITWTIPTGTSSQSVTISPTTVAGVTGTATVVVSGTTATLGNLAPNTLYTVTVNSLGASGFATPATKTFTTVPGSVSNVTFTMATATTGTLSWTNPVGGGTVTVTSTNTGIAIGAIAAGGTSAAISKLVAGTVYPFVITAKNATTSVAGATVNYSVLAGTPVTGVSANVASTSQVVVKFNTVTGATGYNVQMATSATGPWTNMTVTAPVATVPATVPASATVTATAPAAFAKATYYFQVIPVNGTGLGSPSAAVSVNMTAVPATVSTVTFAAGVVGSHSVTIGWAKGSNATSVTISRSVRTVTKVGTTTTTSWSAFTPVTASPLAGNATSYVDSALISGQVYQYQIVETNPAGNSAATASLPTLGFTAP